MKKKKRTKPKTQSVPVQKKEEISDQENSKMEERRSDSEEEGESGDLDQYEVEIFTKK